MRALAAIGAALILSCAGCAAPPVFPDSRARAADGGFIRWVEHLIDDEALGGVPLRGADGLQIADLDRDGHADIVSVHEDVPFVRVAFGTGDPERWVLRTLAAGPAVAGAEDLAIGDLDRDGWLDVVVACEESSLVYLPNPGPAARDGGWPVVVPAGTDERGSWIRVGLADLDRDGDLEVIATNKGPTMPGGRGGMDVPPTPISWFEIHGSAREPTAWTEHELLRLVVPIQSQPIDLDGDGDLDVFAGSRGEGRLLWIENLLDEPGGPLRFAVHALDIAGRRFPEVRAPMMLTGLSVDFADLSGDGRLDVVTQDSMFSVVWLEQPAEGGAPWRLHPLGAIPPDAPVGLRLGDLNGDGRKDLVVGGYSGGPRDHDSPDANAMSSAGRLAWFEQPSDPTSPWVLHEISRRVRGMYDAFEAIDLDGDGLVDLVTTRGNSGEFDGVLWLRQLRGEQTGPALIPARASESRPLPFPDESLQADLPALVDAVLQRRRARGPRH